MWNNESIVKFTKLPSAPQPRAAPGRERGQRSCASAGAVWRASQGPLYADISSAENPWLRSVRGGLRSGAAAGTDSAAVYAAQGRGAPSPPSRTRGRRAGLDQAREAAVEVADDDGRRRHAHERGGARLTYGTVLHSEKVGTFGNRTITIASRSHNRPFRIRWDVLRYAPREHEGKGTWARQVKISGLVAS
jgi:hypothetical protein